MKTWTKIETTDAPSKPEELQWMFATIVLKGELQWILRVVKPNTKTTNQTPLSAKLALTPEQQTKVAELAQLLFPDAEAVLEKEYTGSSDVTS